MSAPRRTLLTLGAIAALLGVAAGAAELAAGTVGWAGNKNDPATLGWVTIGLGVAVGAACALAARSRRPEAQLISSAILLSIGVLGLTTAGLAWVPAAATSFAALVVLLQGRDADQKWSALIRAHWMPALVTVLCTIYLMFGIVDLADLGVVGIIGAVAVVAALWVRNRSRVGAAALLVVGGVPFAAMTAWTVVMPLTAVSMLAIGLPYVTTRTDQVPTRTAR